MFLTFVKYGITIYQYCLVKSVDFVTMLQVRKATRKNEDIQTFTYIYINSLFLANLVLGNILYYSLDRDEIK